MDDMSVTIELKFPVQLADRLLSSVTMRRPIMDDMLNHNVGPGAGLAVDVELIGDLCGLRMEDMRKFDTCDYEKLQDQLLRFRGIIH